MNPYISAMIAAVGLLLSIYSISTARQNTSKAEGKELEHRLTAMESTNVGVKEIESRLTKLEVKEQGQGGSLGSIGAKLERMDNQLTALETKVEVFWKGMIQDAAALLHHPHPEFARRDYLIEQLTANKITDKEARELHSMLTLVWNDQEAPFGERLASSMVMRALSMDFGIEEKRD